METERRNEMMIPPVSELIEFNAFASAMTAAPLDDLHKYYDSDDEQDLEDNYSGDEEEGDEEDNENVQMHDFFDSDQKSSEKGVYFDDLHDADCPDSDSEVHKDVDSSGQSFDWVDPRLDIDHDQIQASHAASRHLNPELQRMIDETEMVLEEMSIEAQKSLDEQPLATRIVLANQAKDLVFSPYAVHGSQARLSEAVMKFLSSGETVMKPGRDGRDKSNDGRLRLAGIVPGDGDGDGKDQRGGVDVGKRQGDIEDGYTGGRSDFADAESRTVHCGKKRKTLTIDTARQLSPVSGAAQYQHNPDVVAAPLGRREQDATLMSHRKTRGPADLTEVEDGGVHASLSQTINLYAEDLKDLELGPRRVGVGTLGLNLYGKTPFTPLADTFLNRMQLQTPVDAQFPSIQTPKVNPPSYSCTFDAQANAALAREAYNPVSLQLTWPATTRSSGQPCMPTPGLLDALNNIIHLTNAEGRFMLSYYVRKYEPPLHIRGTNPSVAPPHALFRLGIAQYLQSRVGNVINNKESDELGLTPEARRVLGEVWEQHPSTMEWVDDQLLKGHNASDDMQSFHDIRAMSGRHKNLRPGGAEGIGGTTSALSSGQDVLSEGKSIQGGLNPVEKTLLARACNVSVETVDAYWDNMRDRTKAWSAMRKWCQARSLEGIARAKADGRW